MPASDVLVLDPVIKSVEKASAPRPGEIYVSISESTGEVNPRWQLLGTVHRYRVFTEKAGNPSADGETGVMQVTDPATQDVVNLRIRYQAICPDDNGERLVKALGRHGDPNGRLSSIVTASARAAIWGKERELFSDFQSVRDVVASKICADVIQETGLRFRAQIRLELEEKLASHRVDERLTVRFKDSPTEHRVRVQCDLDVVPRLTLKAIVSFHNLMNLHANFIEGVKDYFRLEVPAQSYADELRDPLIVEGLQTRFVNLLAADGRTISGLALTALDLERLPPDAIERTLKKEVRTLNREEPILLTSKILLSRDDYAQFQRSQVQKLDVWLESSFEAVIKDVCFEKQYLQYLRRDSWSTIEADIKASMSEKARGIGYKLKQILSAPELKENKFSSFRHHRFNVNGLPLRSTARAHVDLTVDATLCINEWEDDKLSEKINQGVDLESDILVELRDALSTILVNETPNDFVLKFSSRTDNGEPIEARLRKAVSRRLKEEYKAEVSGVVITQVETSEIKRVRELLNHPQHVRFVATPTGGGEVITFDLTWKIVNLEDNSWEIINRPACNFDNIRDHLKRALSGAFSTLEYGRLRYEPEEERLELEELARKQAKSVVSKLFGLIVDVGDLSRERTEREKKIATTADVEFDAKIRDRVEHTEHARQISTAQRKQTLDVLQIAHQQQQRDLERLAELKAKPSIDRTRPEKDELDELERRADLRSALAVIAPAPNSVDVLPSDPQAYQAALLGDGKHEGDSTARSRVEKSTASKSALIEGKDVDETAEEQQNGT